MRRLARASLLLAAAACAAGYAAQTRELALSIGDLQAEAFSARSIRARLSGPRLQALELQVDRLSVAGRTWHKTTLLCPEAQITARRIACASGTLDAGGKVPISFSYLTESRELVAEIKPAPGETWRIAGQFGSSPAAVKASVEGARLERLTQWLPKDLPRITGGRATGTLHVHGRNIKARLDLSGLAFADAAGLRAGEKIAATLEADAAGKGDAWHWDARVAWRAGEVFWQPIFLAGKGQRLEASGSTQSGATTLRQGRLELPGIGTIGFAGHWNPAQGGLTSYEATAERLAVSRLYEDLLKPLAAGTALSDVRAEGQAGFSVRASRGELTAFEASFQNVSFEDRGRRFAAFGLSGRVPWQRDGATAGELTLKGGELLKIPLGAMRVPLRMKGMRVDVERVRVPILDGALTLKNFGMEAARGGWRWRFSAEVSPISMAQLTSALGLPQMHGSLAGVIPELRYRGQTLDMDGALALKLFDGTVRADRVQLIEPFGRAPRLHANLEVKNMDLELLTRTFDFGTITGRIDARVDGLELVSWQPVRFDARVASSPGSYPRRISQRAVQNISALGGAGAAAAIQRSLLRFFDEFGYERLGISCRLENGVCEMDGIERAPQGYVIVKGGGIPAISVIGYNRAVNWRELVERLKRITRENVKPVVK